MVLYKKPSLFHLYPHITNSLSTYSLYYSQKHKLNKWKLSKTPLIAVGDKINEVISGSSAEANKAKAQDSSNTAGERVGAGVDYVKDKAQEAGHAASKEVNKQKAMH